MEISSFSDLFTSLKSRPLSTVVLANGVDRHSVEAVVNMEKQGLIKVIITGDEAIVKDLLKCKISDGIKILHAESEEVALDLAVEVAVNGNADMIMKGLVSTDLFMKAILDKKKGLISKGQILSHITVMKTPAYPKMLILSDVAIIPLPDLNKKQQITKYVISAAHQLGKVKPKVAFIAATEKVIPSLPACTDANELKLLSAKGFFGKAVCDGPMALDVALSAKAAEIKGIKSEVAGDVDCLVFPNIESGNVFYKANTHLCNAETAAYVVGTVVPVILASRGDSVQTKMNSIAIAALNVKF